MILSSIVAYKNYLDKITPIDGALIAHDRLAPTLHSIITNELQFPYLSHQLNQDYQTVLDSIYQFELTVDNIKDKLTDLIEQAEPSYYAESWRLYNQELYNDSTEDVLNRRFTILDDVKRFILARIQQHSNWCHAGLIIHPGHEDWINYLVGLDPLYLVAPQPRILESRILVPKILEPAVLRFNDQYKRRLRTYTVIESANTAILDQLPDSQFGFCLAYNFFNYKPLEIIKQYLNDIYQKLKPGGVLAFTFNDCDWAAGITNAERNFMCYTPGRAIISHAETLGFQIHQRYQIDSGCSWLELKRPGELTSLRGGQTLAKIVYKNTDHVYTYKEKKN
jgi:hypothetical protein